MKKIFVAIFVCLTMLFGLMPSASAYAAETGTTSGSFSVGNVVPAVSAIEIYSDTGLTTVASTIIPQVIYYIKISVTCPNSLDDVKLVTIKVYAEPG